MPMKIPSVNSILFDERIKKYINRYGRGVVVNFIRTALQDIKREKKISEDVIGTILERIERLVFQRCIINATGDPLSNLLINEALKPIEYKSNLIDKDDILYSLRSISEHLFNGRQIVFLNNLSSALSFIRSIYFDREVGVLIATRDIFRIDGFEIDSAIKEAGFELIEVGCSNKVHLRDYQNAIDSASDCPVRVILTASSPRMELAGFVKTTDIEEIDNLVKEKKIIYIHILSDSLPVSPKPGLIEDRFILSHLLKKTKGFIITETSGLMGLPKSSLLIYERDFANINPYGKGYQNYLIEPVLLVNILLSLYNYFNDDIIEKNIVLKCIDRDRDELIRIAKKIVKIFKVFDEKVEIVEDRVFLIGFIRDRVYIKIRENELINRLNIGGVVLGNINNNEVFDVRCVFDNDVDLLKRRI